MLLLTVEVRRAGRLLPGVTRTSVCRRSLWLLVTLERSREPSSTPGVSLTVEPWKSLLGRPAGASWWRPMVTS